MRSVLTNEFMKICGNSVDSTVRTGVVLTYILTKGVLDVRHSTLHVLYYRNLFTEMVGVLAKYFVQVLLLSYMTCVRVSWLATCRNRRHVS